MSVDSGLFIRFETTPSAAGRAVAVLVLHKLIESGWRADDHGRIVFLPIDDNDQFDWQSRSHVEDSAVWAEIEAKAARGEAIGLVLTWHDESVGGEFLVSPENTLTVSLSSNRRTSQAGVTDVTWYLDRIVPPLRSIAHIPETRWTESS